MPIPESISLQFEKNPPIEPHNLIALIQKNKHIKLHGPDRLKVLAASTDLASRTSQIRTALRLLSSISINSTVVA